MSNGDQLDEWTQIAETDFLAARSHLRKPERYRYIVCFHAQQSAEKYLKAILVSKGVDFPKTHDLLTLNHLLERHGVITGFELKQLSNLSLYAVRARYPGDIMTLEEAKEAVETAKLVRKFSRKHLGLK